MENWRGWKSPTACSIPINYDPDGTYKANNYTALTMATDKWSDTTNSDPLDDVMTTQAGEKYDFAGWKENGQAVSVSAAYTVTVTGP